MLMKEYLRPTQGLRAEASPSGAVEIPTQDTGLFWVVGVKDSYQFPEDAVVIF